MSSSVYYRLWVRFQFPCDKHFVCRLLETLAAYRTINWGNNSKSGKLRKKFNSGYVILELSHFSLLGQYMKNMLVRKEFNNILMWGRKSNNPYLYVVFPPLVRKLNPTSMYCEEINQIITAFMWFYPPPSWGNDSNLGEDRN